MDDSKDGTTEYATRTRFMAEVPDPSSFPAITADEVRARAEAAGFEVGTLYYFNGTAFVEATPEQALRMGGIAAGMENGVSYRCKTDGAFNLTLTRDDSSDTAAEVAEECKRAATDCQRATQGLRWAVERFARERGGGNGFSVMAINELAKRADERAACAGGRASDVVATLQGAAR